MLRCNALLRWPPIPTCDVQTAQWKSSMRCANALMTQRFVFTIFLFFFFSFFYHFLPFINFFHSLVYSFLYFSIYIHIYITILSPHHHITTSSHHIISYHHTTAAVCVCAQRPRQPLWGAAASAGGRGTPKGRPSLSVSHKGVRWLLSLFFVSLTGIAFIELPFFFAVLIVRLFVYDVLLIISLFYLLFYLFIH